MASRLRASYPCLCDFLLVLHALVHSMPRVLPPPEKFPPTTGIKVNNKITTSVAGG
jgi:hypothetical protein